ncbi:hypothetical protein [Candidatus Mycoplasma haematominutum]|uniref:hypothetical protein n=1 Tax=Candidatus Mycoplasma haematominutum TaxID=209446 RepID=UPI00165185DF|nr:hypothetical protein [Candidatus Mycoplasma haematominutum]
MFLKALAGAATAVVHLAQKLYETKQVISPSSPKAPAVSSGAPSEGKATDNGKNSVDLSDIKLEEMGPTPDEDGLSY